MRLVLLVAFLVLSGCASTKPTVLTGVKPNIPPTILQPCLPLVTLPPQATIKDVLDVSVSNAEVYLDCKNKQDNSIKLIKELGGL